MLCTLFLRGWKCVFAVRFSSSHWRSLVNIGGKFQCAISMSFSSSLSPSLTHRTVWKRNFSQWRNFPFGIERMKSLKMFMIHCEKIRLKRKRARREVNFSAVFVPHDVRKKSDLNEMFMTLNKHYCISDHRRHHLCMFTFFFFSRHRIVKKTERKKRNIKMGKDFKMILILSSLLLCAVYYSLSHCCLMPKKTSSSNWNVYDYCWEAKRLKRITHEKVNCHKQRIGQKISVGWRTGWWTTWRFVVAVQLEVKVP